MRSAATQAVQSTNFALKNTEVDLIPSAATRVTEIGLAELESMRTATAFVPASKHGLEVICGASCEISAL